MRRAIGAVFLVAIVLLALDVFGVHLHRTEIGDDHRLFTGVCLVVLFASEVLLLTWRRH